MLDFVKGFFSILECNVGCLFCDVLVSIMSFSVQDVSMYMSGFFLIPTQIAVRLVYGCFLHLVSRFFSSFGLWTSSSSFENGDVMVIPQGSCGSLDFVYVAYNMYLLCS